MTTRIHDLKREITEAEFTAQIIDLAHLLGWLVAHFRQGMTKHGWRTPVSGDGMGFPDLVLVSVGQRRVIYAELKRESGRLSAKQEDWLEHLQRCGCEVYVWRPSQFEEITEILRRREPDRPAEALRDTQASRRGNEEIE